MRDYVFVALIALVSGARRCALAPPAILVVESPAPVTTTAASPTQCENPVGVWAFPNGHVWLNEDGTFRSSSRSGWAVLEGWWRVEGNTVHLIQVVGPETVLGTWVDGVPTLTNGAKGRRFVDDGSCIIDDD